jgi:hypothetical protein
MVIFAVIFLGLAVGGIDECWYGPEYTLDVERVWTEPATGHLCHTYLDDGAGKVRTQCDDRDHGLQMRAVGAGAVSARATGCERVRVSCPSILEPAPLP